MDLSQVDDNGIRAPAAGRLSSLVGPAAKAFQADRGERLARAGEPIRTLMFVERGVAAVVVRTSSGETAEAGLIGPGGVVGYAAALGVARGSTDVFAITPMRGLALDVAALGPAAAASPQLRAMLGASAMERMAETERLCACAALHSVERRMARWLSRASELAGGRPIAITHQQLAVLFAVRRATVTTSLHLLEGEKALRCSRGRIEVRDARRLDALSCGCHRPTEGAGTL